MIKETREIQGLEMVVWRLGAKLNLDNDLIIIIWSLCTAL